MCSHIRLYYRTTLRTRIGKKGCNAEIISFGSNCIPDTVYDSTDEGAYARPFRPFLPYVVDEKGSVFVKLVISIIACHVFHLPSGQRVKSNLIHPHNPTF